MKFQIVSDIHLELFDEEESISDIIEPVADNLILAGDIGIFGIWYNILIFKKFLRWCSENYKKVFYVLGNHEYWYSSDLGDTDFMIKESIKNLDNVMVMNNITYEFEEEGIILLGTTLWSYIEGEHKENFSSKFIIRRHLQDFAWLDYQIESLYKKKNKKILVITHHLPSFEFILPQYRHYNSSIFASNLDEYLEKWDIDHWVFGHTHSSIDCDFQHIHFTCNPRGYIQSNGKLENQSFSKNKIIEL